MITNLPDIKFLSLKEKIGQILLYGFETTSNRDPISDDFNDVLEEFKIGNIIFFARNFEDFVELRKLSKHFYETMPIVPLLTIDQEGGVVTRIFRGGTLLPGQMAVAETGSTEHAYNYGKILGTELAACGINTNLAPVLDVNVPGNPGIGVRSFGTESESVMNFSLPVINGMMDSHILATAKHFPGIGAADLDTHLSMPVIRKCNVNLWDCDIPPFRQAIMNGIDLVMTSHSGFTAYAGDKPPLPATLEKKIMTDLLRDRFKFKGVLITDDLEMGGASNDFTFEEVLIKSINAGCDLLSICRDIEKQKSAPGIILNAVESGAIPIERIDESVARIFRLKKKVLDNYKAYFTSDFDKLRDNNQIIANEILEDAIKVKNPNATKTFICTDSKILVLIPGLKNFTKAEELKEHMLESENTIETLIKTYHDNSDFVRYAIPPSDEIIEKVLSIVENYQHVLLFSYNAHLDARTSELVKKLDEESNELVLFTLRNPYDEELVRDDRTVVHAYSPLIPNLTAAIDKFFCN